MSIETTKHSISPTLTEVITMIIDAGAEIVSVEHITGTLVEISIKKNYADLLCTLQEFSLKGGSTKQLSIYSDGGPPSDAARADVLSSIDSASVKSLIDGAIRSNDAVNELMSIVSNIRKEGVTSTLSAKIKDLT